MCITYINICGLYYKQYLNYELPALNTNKNKYILFLKWFYIYICGCNVL